MKAKVLKKESHGFLGWLRYKKIKLKLTEHEKSKGGKMYCVTSHTYYDENEGGYKQAVKHYYSLCTTAKRKELL